MTSEKYIGLDVHQATISVAVMDASGKLVMESILESKASTLLQFLAGLRDNLLESVYHGETGVRMLRELARSYLTIVEDQSRVMNRLKALYRSWGIACAGRDVYYVRHRVQWLEKLREPGVRHRAERLYEQLDGMQRLRRLARHDLLVESRKHSISSKLRQIP